MTNVSDLRVQAEARDVARAFHLASLVVKPTEKEAWTRGMMLRVVRGRASWCATDLHASVRSTFPAVADGEDVVVVEAALLAPVLGRLRGGQPVEMKLRQLRSREHLHLSSGSFRCDVPVVMRDYPQLRDVDDLLDEGIESQSCDSPSLLEMLTRASVCCGLPNRNLAVVRLVGEPDRTWAVSSDSNRLVAIPGPFSTGLDTAISTSAVKALCECLAGRESPCHVSLFDGRLYIRFGDDVSVVARVEESGLLERWRQLVPTPGNSYNIVEFDRLALAAAVERARLIRHTGPLLLSFSENGVVLEAEKAAVGSSKETIDGQVRRLSGARRSCCISGPFLSDALGAMGSQRVQFCYGNDTQSYEPVVLRDPEELEGQAWVIMPMKDGAEAEKR